jgi:hypothetical protein
MTYGWALLVIFIVIAVLFVLTQNLTNETCQFEQPGLACNQPTTPILGSGSKLVGRISNGFGKGVTILQVACTSDRTKLPNATTDFTAAGFAAGTIYSTATSLPAQGVLLLNSTLAQPVVCTSDGTTPAPIASGGTFSGVLYVKYRFADDPNSSDYYRLMKANIIVKAQ